MSDPQLIIDHIDRALANLTSEFDGSTNLRALVSILVAEVQELEEVMLALIVDRTLAGAQGAQLDAWGVVVGEPRNGLSDEDYRRFIGARIITNLGEGEINRLLRVLKTITGASDARYFPHYPAAYLAQYEVDAYTDAGYRARTRAQVEQLTPAGVGFEVVEHTTNAFGFDDDPSAYGFGIGEWAEII